MTLLEAVQTACGELGLTQQAQATSVVGSQDPTLLQMYNLVNREGDTLQKEADWTNMQYLMEFTTTEPETTTGDVTSGGTTITNIPDTSGLVAGAFVVSGDALVSYTRVTEILSSTSVTIDTPATEAQTGMEIVFSRDTYNFPTDFSRFINNTFWDRTNRWQILGPDSPQIDEWHRSGIVVTGPRRHFRQVGNKPLAMRLWPPPGTTENTFTTACEYITKNWAVDADGNGISKMTADDDEFRVDDQAVILGLKWRWLQAKQLSYSAQQAEYNDYVRALVARDGGARTLSMARYFEPYLITSSQVQDGNYPSG